MMKVFKALMPWNFNRSSIAVPTGNKYKPHQGSQKCARRVEKRYTGMYGNAFRKAA